MQSTGPGIDALRLFCPDAGFGDDEGPRSPPHLYPHYACPRRDSSVAEVNSWRMAVRIEKISAVTFRVTNMKASVQFCRDVLGMELVSDGEERVFLVVSR